MGIESFNDKVVIITGASSGIGEALAYQLAQAGAFLALAARSGERLQTVAAECQRLGAKAASFPMDVSDERQCKALVAATLATYDRIDALINNAGFGVRAPLADLPSLDLFVEVLNTNFLGSVYCTYYALPHLKQTRGRIVAVIGLVAKVPLPYFSSYTASKYAMAGFFDVVRMELEGSSVSVTAVYPDFVATRFAANVRDAGGRPRGQDAARSYSEKTMTARECARLIVESAAARRCEVTLSTRGRFVRGLSCWLLELSTKSPRRWCSARRMGKAKRNPSDDGASKPRSNKNSTKPRPLAHRREVTRDVHPCH